MLAQVMTLRYWKSEHSQETCEDAADSDIAQGLFVVADGAGTTLFADAWAAFLVQYFLHVPLLSSDPFEAEWWIRMAQEQFKKYTPVMTDISWNAQQKVQNQGSYATLVALRLSVDEAEHAQAELLAFGDSCVFLSKLSNEQIFSFPLTRTEDFEQAPICLPSKAGVFNRYFHQCRVATLDLSPGDVVVIATDAVAKWIMSSGAGRYTGQKIALQEITKQTTDTWTNFIQECRTHQEMIDDDCTALVLLFHSETTGVSLGVTTEHSQLVKEHRKAGFLQAIEEANKEQIAIYFGDGRDLRNVGLTLSPDDLLLARQVADAQREVLAMLRQEANSPNVVARMTPVWHKHAHLLSAEPCAANLRNTLKQLGIALEPVGPVKPPSRSLIALDIDNSVPHDSAPDLFYTRTFNVPLWLQSNRPTEEEV